MPSFADLYHERAGRLLERGTRLQRTGYRPARPGHRPVGRPGGVVHTFGSGHSELISREIIGRAGGLVCVTGIIDPTGGFIENLPGYGERLAARYDRQYQLIAGETVIVISNSGKNASPIDVALYAKSRADGSGPHLPRHVPGHALPSSVGQEALRGGRPRPGQRRCPGRRHCRGRGRDQCRTHVDPYRLLGPELADARGRGVAPVERPSAPRAQEPEPARGH